MNFWRKGDGLECMLFIARSLELRALPYALNRPPRAAASFNFSVERMAAGGALLQIRACGVRRHRSPPRYARQSLFRQPKLVQRSLDHARPGPPLVTPTAAGGFKESCPRRFFSSP